MRFVIHTESHTRCASRGETRFLVSQFERLKKLQIYLVSWKHSHSLREEAGITDQVVLAITEPVLHIGG